MAVYIRESSTALREIVMPRITATLLTIVLLSFVMFCHAPAAGSADGRAAAASTAGSAPELANQLSAAYGGMLKIKEMLNRGTRSHGFLKNLSTISSASNNFECLFVTRQDKVRIEMEFLGQPKIEAFNGRSGWTQAGKWVSLTDNKTVERIAEEMKHGLNALARLDDLTCKLELLPAKKVNGRNCEVLKLTDSEGKWTTFYIDPVTRLVARSEFTGLDSEQGAQALKTTDYSDYRNVMGFPTPFKIEEFIAGKKSQEATFDEITIDDSINDRLFEMPEESRYSRLDLGPVTIPFEYSGTYIVITARINNDAEEKFVLDTGSSHTVIDKATAQSVGPITTNTFNVTSLARALPLGYAKLDRIQIGDLNIESIPVLVTDLSPLTATIGQRPSGLIGTDILSRFLLTIDFQDRKITLGDPRNARVPDGGIIVPTFPVFASTGLVINGILDNKPLNFLVDTGAAFNLLPYSLAAAFNAGTPLPVGQMTGLEGLKTTIGSIRFNSLKLGNYAINNPVFTIQPDRGSDTSRGLASADMGLLGNSIWSKTRLNIDYRNDRLIIEIPADRLKLDGFLQAIEETDRTYLRNKDSDAAATVYEKIMMNARSDGIKAAEALALARLSGLYADKFSQTKESRWLDMSGKEYEKAAKIAADSRNKSIEGQILAQWAMFYLNAPRSSTDLVSAQNLLKKALSRAPSEGSIYAALGSAMLKTGKSPVAIKFIDQALILDPTNWQALREKYKLFESEHKLAGMKLVLAQMNRYYADFPQVKDLQAKFNKESNKPLSAGSPGATGKSARSFRPRPGKGGTPPTSGSRKATSFPGSSK
jgi:predicted aspartyl protease/tetratricopeptide (TPR) repeat protein